MKRSDRNHFEKVLNVKGVQWDYQSHHISSTCLFNSLFSGGTQDELKSLLGSVQLLNLLYASVFFAISFKCFQSLLPTLSVTYSENFQPPIHVVNLTVCWNI